VSDRARDSDATGAKAAAEAGRDADSVFFSSFEGGLLCRDCEPAFVEKRELRVDPVRLTDLDVLAPADVAGVFDVLDYHVSHVMGRKPAASDALGRILVSSAGPT